MPPAPALFVATPCYGGQATALYMRSLLALTDAARDREIAIHVELGGGEALIGRGRAAMMAMFLRSNASHLLFIDADVGFAPDAVFRLLDAGKDVIGGVYPKKTLGPDGLVVYEVDELPEGGEAASLRKVRSIGTGFLLITRAAVERLATGYPEMRAGLGDLAGAGAAEAVMVFDSFIEPGTGRYLADHQAFCHRWRALGGEVWADFVSPLEHIGVVVHASPGVAAG